MAVLLKSWSVHPNSTPHLGNNSSLLGKSNFHSSGIQIRAGNTSRLLDGRTPVFRSTKLSVAGHPRVYYCLLPNVSRTDPIAWFKPDSTLINYHLTLVQQKPTAQPIPTPTASAGATSTRNTRTGLRPKPTAQKLEAMACEICMTIQSGFRLYMEGCRWWKMPPSTCVRHLHILSAHDDKLPSRETSKSDSHLFPHRRTNSVINPYRCPPPNGYSRRPSCPPSWYCAQSNCTACNVWLRAVDDPRCKPFVVDAIGQHEDSPCPHSLDRCKPFVVDTFGQHKDSLCPSSLKPPWSSPEYALDDYRFALLNFADMRTSKHNGHILYTSQQ